MRRGMWALCLLMAAGCGEGTDRASEVDGALLADAAFGRGDAALGDSGASAPDAELGDAEIDATLADAALADAEAPDLPDAGSTIESCEAACARFEACGRAETDWGSAEACRLTCERFDDDAARATWFECLSSERCELLRFCPAPEPAPLSCGEICAAVEGCDLGGPLGDCEATCEALGSPQREALASCGELLTGACQPAAFWQCVGGTVYQDPCGVQCQGAVECELSDIPSCVTSCLEGLLSEDPLARHRTLSRGRCVQRRPGRCEAIATCFDPPPLPPLPELSCDAVCEINDLCGGPLNGCPDTCEAFRLRGFERFTYMVWCLYDALPPEGQACTPDLVAPCLLEDQQPRPVIEGCAALCEAESVCDLLPEGLPPVDCSDRCRDDLLAGGPEGLAWREAFVCRGAGLCAELGECLTAQASPAQCEVWCGALAGCGLDDQLDGDCVAGCQADYASARDQAWRACVAEAPDCDAMAACAPPPPPPCDLYCDRLDGCGLGGEGCRLDCDDAHFNQPDGAIDRVACALSAPACAPAPGGPYSVEACLSDDGRGGALPDQAACYHLCRDLTACDPATPAAEAEAALAACLGRCGEGLPTEDALRLQGAACLDALAPTATCEAVTACAATLAPEVDCPAHCAALDACDLAPDGCAEACPEPAAAACVAEATRLGQGCAAVAACVGVEVPPPSPACAALCDLRSTCGDPSFDRFLCARACDPDEEALAVQRACIEQGGCAHEAACLTVGREPPPACEAACALAAPCPAPWGAEGDCATRCAGLLALPAATEAFVSELAPCLEAATADGVCAPEAAAACFNPQPSCQEICTFSQGCGLAPNICESLLCPDGDLDPESEFAQCAFEIYRSGVCDLDLFFACVER